MDNNGNVPISKDELKNVITNAIDSGIQSLLKYKTLSEYLDKRLEDPGERVLLNDVLAHRIWKTPIPNMEDFKQFAQKVESYYSTSPLEDPSGGYDNFGVTRYFNFMDFEELQVPMHSWTFTSTAKIMYSNQYNHPKVHIEKGDYVLDAGVLFGDTSLWFSYLTGENGKVFSFEFTPAFIERIQNNLEINSELASRIKINPFALWNKSGEKLCFTEKGGATQINQKNSSDGAVTAETITIDDWAERYNIEKLDFIKMDIEGAEVRALNGAKRTIQRFKPKLAICLYHNDADFVTIPSLIDSFGVDYEFYLGHHTAAFPETVLYAKARD
ncbi:hypothetical protein GCM10023310_54440 [Paenibacillus vulneris]|uniref:FkbM family methyltransferase n=1 Tax=Paenibacillus vulneris TaxID=1133364 RepID=A0ABW3UZD5_9BACL